MIELNPDIYVCSHDLMYSSPVVQPHTRTSRITFSSEPPAHPPTGRPEQAHAVGVLHPGRHLRGRAAVRPLGRRLRGGAGPSVSPYIQCAVCVGGCGWVWVGARVCACVSAGRSRSVSPYFQCSLSLHMHGWTGGRTNPNPTPTHPPTHLSSSGQPPSERRHRPAARPPLPRQPGARRLRAAGLSICLSVCPSLCLSLCPSVCHLL